MGRVMNNDDNMTKQWPVVNLHNGTVCFVLVGLVCRVRV